MRNLVLALLVVGLLAAPSMATVTIKLTADNTTLTNGQTTVVHVFAKSDSGGVYSVGGRVAATPVSGSPDVLTTVSDATALHGMTFTAAFSPTGLITPKASAPGAAGALGGWGDAAVANSGFGSQQTVWATPDPALGNPNYVEVCSYVVKADAAPVAGVVSLAFDYTNKAISGFKPLDTNSGIVWAQVPVSITVIPEPVTMALLAIGGLMVARRRR